MYNIGEKNEGVMKFKWESHRIAGQRRVGFPNGGQNLY